MSEQKAKRFNKRLILFVKIWLGREDSNLEMANWKSDALACPREAAELLSVEIHK
jgi:hypothetical protein